MADSSYTKIYKLLMKTTTFAALEDKYKKMLQECYITDVSWRRGTTENGLAVIKPTFHFSLDIRVDDVDGYVSLSQVPSDEEFEKVINLHFGQDVKTYFCKASTVRKGGSKSNNDYQESFADYARGELRVNHEGLIESTKTRIKQLMKERSQTEEFQKERHAQLVIQCKKNIVRAMMPWREMDDQVLRDAWDEFMCQSIIET